MNTENLLTDEAIIYEGKLHWSIFIVPAIMCFFDIGVIIGLLVTQHAVPAGLLCLLLPCFLAPSLLRYKSNTLVLTNKRVISSKGVASRRSIDIALSKIEGVSVDQNILGQLFNYGTIIIRGTGGGIEEFPLLAAPADFSKALHQHLGSGTDRERRAF